MLFRKREQKWQNWFAWFPVKASTPKGIKRVWLRPVRCIWYVPVTAEKLYFFYRIDYKYKVETDRTLFSGDHSDLPLSEEGKKLSVIATSSIAR